MNVSKSICNGERNFLFFVIFEMEKECKVFCVKLVLWSIVAQKGTHILIFIFSNLVLYMVLNVVLNLVLNSISYM